MTNKCVITGTDTGVGKTIFSAMLMLGLDELDSDVSYWKPVQSGIEEIDTKSVQDLTELPTERFFPESYVLTEPLSPHRSAELDNIEIDVTQFKIPEFSGPLLIEGAGGLMVPLTRDILLMDLFAQWRLPTILCTRTSLGTINHTLLSIEALQKRNIPVHGLAFIGEDNPDNIRTIHEYSGIKVLGRLPKLDSLSQNTLKQAFKDNFNTDDFFVADDQFARVANSAA
ncbi:MAG: dethiobiotin synthase [Pseudomonadota bacterium]